MPRVKSALVKPAESALAKLRQSILAVGIILPIWGNQKMIRYYVSDLLMLEPESFDLVLNFCQSLSLSN
jgi:hypothetical protein